MSLEDAIEQHRKKNKKYESSSCALVGVIHNDEYQFIGNTSCHMGLNYREKGTTHILHAIQYKYEAEIDRELGEEFTKEYESVFWEWLLVYSPWRHIFLEKDPKKVDDILIVTTEEDRNFVVSALVAARYVTENRRRVIVMVDLIKLGVHPNLAYVISHGWKKVDNELVPHNWGGWHVAINPAHWKKDIVFNLIKEIRSPVSSPSYFETGRYDGFDRVWVEGGRERYGEDGGADWWVDMIRHVKDSISEKSDKKINPFGKEKATSIPYDKGIIALASLIQQEFPL